MNSYLNFQFDELELSFKEELADTFRVTLQAHATTLGDFSLPILPENLCTH